MKIRKSPIIIPRGTFLFAFFTSLEIGIAYSAPIKSQNATAVIDAIPLKSASSTNGWSTFAPMPAPIIPINPITTSEPTSKNATIS